MSAGLLLRLFQSEYFNVHLAVSYLKTYPDSVGITYYLVHRLAHVDESELDFYWPQICHLVISHASQSGALEGLIIKKCEESIHLAMLTLWQMQASLSDLSMDPGTAAFATCRRIYNRVQHVIFSDALLENTLEARTSRLRLRSQRAKPACVGMAVVAAALAMPALAEYSGQIALEEGRKQASSDPLERHDDSVRSSADAVDAENDPPSQHSNRLLDTVGRHPYARGSEQVGIPTVPKEYAHLSSPLNTGVGIAVSHSQPSSPAWPATLPSRSSTSASKKSESALRSSSSRVGPRGPLAQPREDQRSTYSASMLDLSSNGSNGMRHPSGPVLSAMTSKSGRTSPDGRSSAQRSSPQLKLHASQRKSLASPRQALSTPTLVPLSASSGNLLRHSVSTEPSLPTDVLSLLLRSYACRSQLDLLTSLQDISTRLIVVPKVARSSALRAELTVLNHGLPRGCCLCLGCFGQGSGSLVTTSDGAGREATSFGTSIRSIFAATSTTTPRKAHHRIVRIPPSESVVLNSADRAPFVIHVEVLDGDLDFDPHRRQNAEDVRHVVLERENASVAVQTSHGATQATMVDQSPSSGSPTHPLTSASPDDFRDTSPSPRIIPKSPGAQLRRDLAHDKTFELDKPLRSSDHSATGSLEEVDLVEQAYGHFSIRDEAASPPLEYHPQIHNRAVDEATWQKAENAGSPLSAPGPKASQLERYASETGNRRPLTLDAYAERMRMAAIMLAQINASQQEPMSGASAVSGVVGAGVGIGVNLTYGVGSVVSSVVGVGVDVLRASISGNATVPASLPTMSDPAPAGQANSDVQAPIPEATAVSAHSGTIPIAPEVPSTAHSRNADNTVHQTVQQSAANGYLHPRQRVLTAQEASTIRERIMSEMMSLEEERMARMKNASTSSSKALLASASFAEPKVEEEAIVMRAVNKDDPSGSVLAESWTEKKSRIRKGSPFGHLFNWDVFSVIVKTGADLRQEQLAVQLIREFGRIWSEIASPHWIRYFRILVTSESTGLMETITDAVSVHSIKKEAYARMTADSTDRSGYLPSYSLYDHFVSTFGQPDAPHFRRAQDAFMKSLASYSIITYLLQIKDRHNGNILIDKHGHLMHIDFGFMLSNSPGSMGFEKAPFKFTQDYIDILGGTESAKYQEFKSLLKRLFRDVRQHAERIITMVELMQAGSRLPCFSSGVTTSQNLRDRFQLALPASQVDDYVERLVLSSAGSAFTRLYDTFQRHSQGVL